MCKRSAEPGVLADYALMTVVMDCSVPFDCVSAAPWALGRLRQLDKGKDAATGAPPEFYLDSITVYQK